MGPLVATMRPARRYEGTAVERGDAAAGLLDQQHAGRDVPRVEALLPEAVHASAGDVADVERRRPEAAHGARFAEKRGEQADQLRHLVLDGVRKAGHQQRVDERLGLRHVESRAVEERALAAFGGEQLVARRVVHRADLEPSVHFERHRAAEQRQPVREVRRAVERVDDPAEPRARLAGRPAQSPRPARRGPGCRSAMSARIMRSTARSTSVTRSIVPFL